jgi:hypothetical protein
MYVYMEESREHEVKRPHGVLGVNACIILQQITDTEGERTWNEFIWLGIASSGWLLCTRQRTFEFTNRRRVWLAEGLSASDSLCSTS